MNPQGTGSPPDAGSVSNTSGRGRWVGSAGWIHASGAERNCSTSCGQVFSAMNQRGDPRCPRRGCQSGKRRSG